MVDSGLAVRGRRSFEENEFGSAFPQREALLKRMILLPSLKDFRPHSYQVQTFVFFESHIFFHIFAAGSTPSDF
jgi:hypothetical protein